MLLVVLGSLRAEPLFACVTRAPFRIHTGSGGEMSFMLAKDSRWERRLCLSKLAVAVRHAMMNGAFRASLDGSLSKPVAAIER